MKDRIFTIRKREKLSMQAFADRIGVSREAIRLLENGTTKAAERTVRDICKEFGINKEWLLTGEGDIDAPKSEHTSLDALAEAHNINGLTRAIIEGLITMRPEHQAAFIDLINTVAAKVRNAEYEQVTPETVAAIIAAKAQDVQEPAEPSEPHTV